MTRSVLFGVAMLSAAVGPAPPEQSGADAALTAEDARELDALLREFLFDPSGAERVRANVPVYSPFGGGTVEREGWLVRVRVYLTDGYSVPAPETVAKVDFLAACRRRYGVAPPPKPGGGIEDDLAFRRMRQTAAGIADESDLALAAWLHRLGHDDLAAKALAAARQQSAGRGNPRPGAGPPPGPRDLLRSELAWQALAGLVHAYVNRADAEALEHGERLMRLYPEAVGEGTYRQAKPLVAELRRRKEKGTFGRVPSAAVPAAFAGDPSRTAAWLIDALEEVDARQQGQPGGVDLGSDWRVKELIAVGDPAVPALIDAVEKDGRLTRSVQFWRDFARSRKVLSVREAALVALMSILRVRVFEPAATGDNFTARGEEAARETAAKLRAYWAEYGRLPFDERLMKVLTDPMSPPEACWEAASNLATLGGERVIGTTVWTGRVTRRPAGPNPAVAKFRSPTAAEAILAVLDRELARPAADPKDAHRVRTSVLAAYLWAVAELGDARVGPELARRAAATADLDGRRMYAAAAFHCGTPGPGQALARELAAGILRLPEGPAEKEWIPGRPPDPASAALSSLIALFTDLDVPEGEAALHALARPGHPYRAVLVRRLLDNDPDGYEDQAWYFHPYCLTVLRQLLDDTTPTGARYRIEKDSFLQDRPDGRGRGLPQPLEGPLADPAVRKTAAEERVCDRAMLHLSTMAAGMPEFHPLRTDSDDLIRQGKGVFDRFGGSYRLLHGDRERDALGYSPFGPKYLPRVPPLGRPATAADVDAGKAVFHLDGRGKVADVKLPVWLVLKADAGKKNSPRGLAVQAEVSPDGVVYGAVFRNAIRAVPAGEVGLLLPWSPPR